MRERERVKEVRKEVKGKDATFGEGEKEKKKVQCISCNADDEMAVDYDVH